MNVDEITRVVRMVERIGDIVRERRENGWARLAWVGVSYVGPKERRCFEGVQVSSIVKIEHVGVE